MHEGGAPALILRPGVSPDRLVVWEPERRMTAADVLAASEARRAACASCGIGPGTRVMLACHARAETLVDAAALGALGAAVVPVSPTLTQAEREGLASRFGIRFVVELNSVTPTGAPAPASPPAFAGPPVLGLLSSGSTGAPKLVWRSSAQVEAASAIFQRSLPLEDGDRVLAVIPPEHSYGFQNLLWNTVRGLLTGGAAAIALVFPRTQHPRAVVRRAREAGVTVFPGAPAFLDMVTRSVAPEDMPEGLRVCISVGTALSARIHGAFTSRFGVPLWQSYGASEAGPVCLNRRGTATGDLVDLGTVCDGVTVRIVGDDGAEAADGVTGEMVIETPAVGLGYEGGTDGASRMEPGVFHTGDLGVREGGTLRFAGRRKLLIAAAGNKVDPVEVEEALLAHPAVADVAVVPHRTEDARELVKALVVRRGEVDAVALMDFCAGRLAAFKVPRIVEFRESLPRNAMGKLLRAELDA